MNFYIIITITRISNYKLRYNHLTYSLSSYNILTCSYQSIFSIGGKYVN